MSPTQCIFPNEELDFDDVMIRPKESNINSRFDVKIVKPYHFKWSDKVIEGNPAIAANMATTGTFEIAKVMQKHRMFTALHKHYTAEQLIAFLKENAASFGNNDYIFIGTGLRSDDFEKLNQVMRTGLCHNICLDAPNGYIQAFKAHLNKLRHYFPKAVIMAGNIVTGEKAKDIIMNGADVVKVGIGSSAVCRTRRQTGVGRPQFSAIQECIQSVKSEEGMVCSDGGVTCAGDYVKAIGAGCDFVMMGGYLAGCDESAGQLITKFFRTNEVNSDGTEKIEEKKYKLFYGMSSKFAQEKHYDGMPSYRASEGTVMEIPYKGPIENTLQELEGGLRSACTYTNTSELSQFHKNVQFYRVRKQLNRCFGYNEKE